MNLIAKSNMKTPEYDMVQVRLGAHVDYQWMWWCSDSAAFVAFCVEDTITIETDWRKNQPCTKIMTNDLTPSKPNKMKVIIDLEEMHASIPGYATIYNVARVSPVPIVSL